MKTTRTREDLVQTYRRLSAALADEALPESEARAVREQLKAVRAEIDQLPWYPTQEKRTVKPSEIRVGDLVVGFKAPVAGAVVRTDPGAVAQTTVTFADGETWTTSDHFVTTVMR